MTSSRPLPRTAVRGVFVCLALVLLPMPAAGTRALADEPIPLARTGQITDRAGALGDRQQAVERALDRLHDQRGVRLFIAYVRNFSGWDATDWAYDTARRNGLDRDDVLLAVATQDREYAWSAHRESPLTQAQLQGVSKTAILPPLRKDDWAGAAIGAADGYRAVLAGKPVPKPSVKPGPVAPGEARSATGDLVLPIVAVGGAAALAVYAATRRKHRVATRTTPHGGRVVPGPPPRPLSELHERAARLLVEADDAVRTSTEELGFAAAQLGAAAVRPFGDAVAYAEEELRAAFRLRQQLDDGAPEDDAAVRRMLDEIISRSTEANHRLDLAAQDFDARRDLEKLAPEALNHAEAAFRDAAGRTGTAEATLTALAGRYADSASAPVAGHAEEAKERLVFAADRIDRARQAVEAGDNATAAVQVRAAEAAVGQAVMLVDAVDRLAQELAEAAGKLPSARTETEGHVTEARALLQDAPEDTSTAEVERRLVIAERVLGDVSDEVEAMGAARYDPMDALRRVEEADAALAEALSGAGRGERKDAAQRSRALLDQALLAARSSIGTASDYLTTHRGAVACPARTRLTQAQRQLARSDAVADRDAVTALAEARRADALAREARELAGRDVAARGGPYGGAEGDERAAGGAVIGGILLEGGRTARFGGGGTTISPSGA
ncbi:TPM domain-containing protein [Streptomyces sp. NPDC002851]